MRDHEAGVWGRTCEGVCLEIVDRADDIFFVVSHLVDIQGVYEIFCFFSKILNIFWTLVN